MANKNVVTIKVYEEDRNWIERIKRKLKKSSFPETIVSIKKLISSYKIEGEIK